MSLLGASPKAVTGQNRLMGRANYFIGRDPSKWLTAIPRYGTVRYREAWPGIDLSVSGNDGKLEYDFSVVAGADPRVVALGFPGADRLRIDRRGTLVVTVDGVRWVHRPPFAYQWRTGHMVPVRAAFRIDPGREVRFDLGPYDATLPLVIDPVLSFSSYLGGTYLDYAFGVAVDASGSAYVTGQTWSSDFPVKGGLSEQKGMAFVSKIAPDGSDLVYSTYLGGDNYEFLQGLYEQAFAVAVDAAGSAYVVGQTPASDFPVVNAIQDTNAGGAADAFISKLDSSGSSLVYSTYLGGEREDWASAVTVDTAGDAYVTGYTASYTFPLKDPLPMDSTADDAFVSELDPSGSSLVYSTRFGGYTPFSGSNSESGQGIAVDSTGAVVFAGWTESSLFPLVNPFQPTYGGGDFDGFIAKLSPGGDSIVYSTYFGGSDSDQLQALALDPRGDAYVTGWTSSKDLPTLGAIEECNRYGDNLSSSSDALVAKVSPTGTLLYSTYLGGDWVDYGRGITVDADGTAFVVGDTMSFDFPAVHPIQREKGQAEDAFVTGVESDGSRLSFSTFLGGGSTQDFYSGPPRDHARAVASDATGSLYVAGDTYAPDFPTRHPFQGTLAGEYDAFVAKIASPGGSPSSFHKTCTTPVAFEQYQYHDVGSWPAGVAIGDVTGDGRNDALMTTTFYAGEKSDGKLIVFRQRRDGSLAAPKAYPTHNGRNFLENGVAVGDLSGDGLLDAAVAVGSGVDIYVQEGGRLRGPTLLPVAGDTDQVEIADVTGDGLDDMVVATAQDVLLLTNSGGTFETTTVADSAQLEVEVGDVNGDGRMDVVGTTQPRSMHVFPQNVDGTFGPSQDYEVLDDGEPTPAGIEAADVTGDGRTDVVVSLGGNVPYAMINVFAQRPDGTLGSPLAYHTRDIPESVEAADLTGDGRNDVVSANGGWGSISVNLQEPDGAMAPYQLYWIAQCPPDCPSVYEPKGLALGDLNGDGRVDVALADYIHGLVVLYQSST